MGLGNQYTRALGPLFADTPKAVWAAIAFSLAMRLNEDAAEAAVKELVREWVVLHQQGIIPQSPTRLL